MVPFEAAQASQPTNQTRWIEGSVTWPGEYGDKKEAWPADVPLNSPITRQAVEGAPVTSRRGIRQRQGVPLAGLNAMFRKSKRKQKKGLRTTHS